MEGKVTYNILQNKFENYLMSAGNKSVGTVLSDQGWSERTVPTDSITVTRTSHENKCQSTMFSLSLMSIAVFMCSVLGF